MTRESQDLLDKRVQQELREIQDQLDQLVYQALLGRQGQLDPQEGMDPRGMPGILEKMVTQDRRETLVSPAPLAPLETKAIRVTPGRKVSLARLDQLG